MNNIFNYNENQALNGGVSNYIETTGAYCGKITGAYWINSFSNSKGLRLSFETTEGLKTDYLTVFYEKSDGSKIDFGCNLIQAIMGCTNTANLSNTASNGMYIAKELVGKSIGLFLRKELYLKESGEEGYRFHIQTPFSPVSFKTLKEHKENKEASYIKKLIATVKDLDNRGFAEMPRRGRPKKENPDQVYEATKALYSNQFDDDIPF